ncbi:MAG TPA: hypothetical protein VGZ32_08060 [Actinocrinis sp.]|jgi:DNA repair photolyase|uniref:hypothetical protein n=1 Tax=Actinocrinis sp. TaxID=1920516 RepID=UPI002DDCB12E|nr:hypothetical protein [Actinocrinis sp.]HEV3170277.1 hypothetical protein [Actinocrinis sp.]
MAVEAGLSTGVHVAPMRPFVGVGAQEVATPRDTARIVEQEATAEDVVARMLELHADRDNPRVLRFGAGQAVAKRS